MSISTAPTAIANLLTAISTQPACVTTDGFVFGIRRGEPVHDWPVDDGIYIAQTRRTTQRMEMRNGTVGYLREDFVIVVEIACFRGGDNVTDVENRAWQLVNAVETAIRNDLTLAGAVLEAWPESTDVISEWDPENAGRRARATVNVHAWSAI